MNMASETVCKCASLSICMLMCAAVHSAIWLHECEFVCLYAHIVAAPNHTVTVAPPAEAGSK